MVHWCCLAGLTVALLAPCPVLARQADPGSASAERDIVVTGELPPQREVTRQARAITVPTGIDTAPLPLFADRLCPGVFGIRSDFAAVIIDRIRANAERFELPMTEDDGTCAPNFVVAFVDDGRMTLQEIADEQYRLFRGTPWRERLKLLAEDGPARAWTATETRTRDGVPLPEDPVTGVQTAAQWNAASRVLLPVREDIVFVLVLIERNAAPGRTLLQLADYATMRGLARTRPVEADRAPLDTILVLFDPSAEPPSELTAFDSAYLGALYRGSPAKAGLGKVVAVNGELRRQAAAEQAAGAAEAPVAE